MAHIQAFVVITLLIWAAVSVSGTTTGLSTTAGDTVNIPCHFGEGTVQNIFWYFKYCTTGHKIVFFVKEELTFGDEYANRTSLQKDNSTLILRNITVADEGTYCCIVDRQGQLPVQNITRLNVFSLRPDTLPKITPCSQADESSSCIIRRNQSFTLTCTLPNVYPVEDTELIWYQDGKRVLSTDNITQNDDGTTDINRQIQVSKTGNFTCNATYLTANERENTSVSVEACIIPPANVTNTTDKNLTDGAIVGIALSVATVLIVGILLCTCCLKKRSKCCFKKDEQKSKVIQPNLEELTPLKKSAKDGSKDGNAESSEPTERPTADANRSIQEEVDNSNQPPPSTVTQEGNMKSSEQTVTEKQLRKLAGCLPAEKFTDVAINLEVGYTEHGNTRLQNPSSIKDAHYEILMKWKMTAGGGKVGVLDKALKEADCEGIVYKDV